LQKQGALADGELRFRADAEELRRFFFKTVVMIDSQLFQRCPFLTAVPNELAFVFANRTTSRRLRGFGKLRPALYADKILHYAKFCNAISDRRKTFCRF
jgi:hypothetical protein